MKGEGFIRQRSTAMRAASILIGLLLIASCGPALAEPGDVNERSFGAEMNRERAESRIERLRRKRQQKKDTAPNRGQQTEQKPMRQPRGTRNF